MTNGMKYFLGAVGLTTLFLGGLGVMNVMLVAVRERTREIGVRKAVGAQSRNIMMQFFVETMIVVFVSGGLGMAISFGFCALFNLLPMPQYFAGLLPTWQSGSLSVGLLGLVAVLAAMYPARRAASHRSDRSLALRGGWITMRVHFHHRRDSRRKPGSPCAAVARAACSPCWASCGASSRSPC